MGFQLAQAQELREAVAGLRAQLQDARQDGAAASATRDILAEQLHAATTAMADQVPVQQFQLVATPHRLLTNLGMLVSAQQSAL